jgi:hypothetical protein
MRYPTLAIALSLTIAACTPEVVQPLTEAIGGGQQAQGYQFTYADYSQIQSGQTLADVQRILGQPGKELSSAGDTVVHSFENTPATNGVVIVTIQGGKVLSKSQSALSP